jgi:hypothetical protein
MDPLPGNGPRSVGSVGSRLQATHTAPARSATVASASNRQPVSGLCPCTTATARSARSVVLRPTAVSSAASAAVPTTSTGEPGGSCRASIAAAACELVTTSSVVAGKPSSARWAATSAGAREALLVM